MNKKRSGGFIKCLGAVIGAGFASGREIAAFFSDYGVWSLAGILLSAGCMGLLAWFLMRKGILLMDSRWMNALMALLMGALCGAMATAAGELFALALPLYSAYMLGFLGTLAFCFCYAASGRQWLRGVSMALLPLLLIYFMAALCMPDIDGPGGPESAWFPLGLVKAISYSGLNMLLASPVLIAEGRELNRAVARQSATRLALALAGLLILGNWVLLTHPAARQTTLPMIALTRGLGKAGYYFSILVMYLAVLTTCMAGAEGMLRHMRELARAKGVSLLLCLMTVSLCSALGFEKITGVLYPLLGGVCLIYLVVKALRKT